MRKTAIVSVWLVLAASAPGASDCFQQIKEKLSSEGCSFFEFLSIIESDVFETVDTALGTAYLAGDGRYNIRIVEDHYIFDGRQTYSYSPGSNQVIIETPSAGRAAADEFSFITRLDSLYETSVLKKGVRYRLTRRVDIVGDYPDSMEVTVDSKNLLLKQLSYLDVNDDLNVIVFRNQNYAGPCFDSLFVPDFPDSAETVKL